LQPAEDITQTDAAMRESMTTPLHRAQRCYRTRPGRIGCRAGWAAGRRAWRRPLR